MPANMLLIRDWFVHYRPNQVHVLVHWHSDGHRAVIVDKRLDIRDLNLRGILFNLFCREGLYLIANVTSAFTRTRTFFIVEGILAVFVAIRVALVCAKT